MVVGGQSVGLGREGVEERGEPHVLADDLACRLDVLALGLLRVGNAPAGGATRAGFLRDAEGDAVDEGSGDHGTLAVPGASSHAEALGVDVVARRGLESVDDAVDSPGPGRQGTCAVAGAVEVVELSLSTAALSRLLSHVVVVERDGRDSIGNRNARSAIGDDGRNTGTGVALDGDREGNGLAALASRERESAARVRRGEGRWLWWEGSELLSLESGEHLLVLAVVVGLGLDVGAVEELERVGQLRVRRRGKCRWNLARRLTGFQWRSQHRSGEKWEDDGVLHREYRSNYATAKWPLRKRNSQTHTLPVYIEAIATVDVMR